MLKNFSYKMVSMGFIMFILSLFLMFFGFMSFNLNWSWTGEWEMLSIDLLKFKCVFYIDGMSLIFLSTVIMISSMVMFYSMSYMENEKYLGRFFYLVILFIVSMCLMILSPNALSILLGWDGLGVISYLLVIFFQNKESFNSGMLTILINRLGDIGLIMLICFSGFYGSWNFLFYGMNIYMVYLLMIAVMTKSAQMPFSIWLPAAMTAPTPVSSLVHSSTLVTAGVYLLIRYYPMMFSFDMKFLLLSSFTMFIAGVLANFDQDLKKIIAFSTLSQLGFMMCILSIGNINLAFFHLIIHAFFKSLLFLIGGSFIHSMNDNQDIRKYGGFIYFFPFKSIIMIFSLLSLCGVPFISGFYSKDLIFENLFNSSVLNSLSLLMIYLSTILTISYSFRLILWLLISNDGVKNDSYNVLHENMIMSKVMMILMVLVLLFGWFYMNIVYFYYSFLILNTNKIFILSLFILGSFLGAQDFSCLSLKLSLLMNFMSMFFFLKLFYVYLLKDVLMVGYKYIELLLEKGLFETFMGMLVLKFLGLKNFFKKKNKLINMMLILKLYLLILVLGLVDFI